MAFSSSTPLGDPIGPILTANFVGLRAYQVKIHGEISSGGDLTEIANSLS